MPAPTALLRNPEALSEDVAVVQSLPLPADEDTELLNMNALPSENVVPTKNVSEAPMEDIVMTDEVGRPRFAPAKDIPLAFHSQNRKVPIPPHRMSPLKNAWPKIYPPLVEHLKLQVRMNMKTKSVELRTSSHTTDTGALQKGADFVKAFTLGFDTDDAIALLRLVSCDLRRLSRRYILTSVG